jgi:hypothetical protein
MCCPQTRASTTQRTQYILRPRYSTHCPSASPSVRFACETLCRLACALPFSHGAHMFLPSMLSAHLSCAELDDAKPPLTECGAVCSVGNSYVLQLFAAPKQLLERSSMAATTCHIAREPMPAHMLRFYRVLQPLTSAMAASARLRSCAICTTERRTCTLHPELPPLFVFVWGAGSVGCRFEPQPSTTCSRSSSIAIVTDICITNTTLRWLVCSRLSKS